jgi:hypothetical protein
MKIWLAAAVAVLAALSFFQFPGHTWLQQDTQIYVPILEHLRDPSLLSKDILVERPHVAFTLYDECAIGLRNLTGLGFREILGAGQFLTRALGIWGFLLMATAAGLEFAPALLVTAILTLGGWVLGPQVLLFEFEPTPRAFAVPLLYLGVGLTAHRRFLAAGVAGAAAFLIHPPTVYPFWVVYACLALFPTKPDVMLRRISAFAPLLAATLILFLASRFQPGQNEAQAFFTSVGPLMEKLQRMRANYVWISAWWRELLPQYLVLYGLTLVSYLRVRAELTPELRWFHLGLPLVGLLSMPLSWLLLEHFKWALVPQFQPMRALLFITLFAVFGAAVAASIAARRGRYPEAFLWFAAAWLTPVHTLFTEMPGWRHSAVILLLSAATCASYALLRRSIRYGGAALAATGVAAFFLIPSLGGVVNYPHLHTTALAELSGWARQSTPADAVFLFPNFGKDLAPGIFRSEALRAVYVDWKGGGQVNYLKELGEQWWSRWQRVGGELLNSPDEYRKMGIDYLVVRRNVVVPGLRAVFQNARFTVYRI